MIWHKATAVARAGAHSVAVRHVWAVFSGRLPAGERDIGVCEHGGVGARRHLRHLLHDSRRISTAGAAYVGMTRLRHNNELFVYQRTHGEADHEHTSPVGDVHVARRGNKYSAAHCLHVILQRDERPRTMHAEAGRTDRDQLPPAVVGLLERHDERRVARREAWLGYTAPKRSRHHDRSHSLDHDIGIDL